MSKHGAGETRLLVDGYDLTGARPKSVSFKRMFEHERTDGVAETDHEHTPTGMRSAELVQSGAFFDTATNGSHDALVAGMPASPQAVARVAAVMFAGETIGQPCIFATGYSHEYEYLSSRDELTKANVTYQLSGQVDLGVILQPKAAQTADWDTSASSVDNAASSANGGVGVLQVTAASGFTNFVGTIKDSPDDAVFSDLIVFTDNVVAPFAERLTVAGTVDRYLAFYGNVTGTGSITAFCGFARNA